MNCVGGLVMDEAEFDKFAEEYRELSEQVLGISGEDAQFFAEYKIRDTAGLVRKFNLPDNLRVLDFGAGIGTSTPWLRQYLPNCELDCVDVSRKSLEIAEYRFPDMARYTHFDGATLPWPENSFDLVFSACVFHHIPPAERPRLLAELRRVLKPGGLFVSFEHNPKNFLTVRAVNACRFDENAILLSGQEFLSKLNAAELTNPHLRYRIFFPGFLRALRPLEKFMTWLPLGAQYYVWSVDDLFGQVVWCRRCGGQYFRL